MIGCRELNQVTLDLRIDFHGLLRVEQAVPIFELDPIHEDMHIIWHSFSGTAHL